MTTANNKQNVSVGKGNASGYIYVAPSGTTLPTDATTALANAYTCLGYIDDDGVTRSYEVNQDENEFFDMNGDNILEVEGNRKVTEKFSFNLVETKEDVLKQVYGSNSVSVDSTTQKITASSTDEEPAAMVYVFEILLTGNRAKRIIVPDGKVFEWGDTQYASGELVKYPTTIKANMGTSGFRSREYIQTITS